MKKIAKLQTRRGSNGNGSKKNSVFDSKIIKAESQYCNRLLIGIPSTGLIRIEWHFSQQNVVLPVNFSSEVCSPRFSKNLLVSPLGFHVDHARNICCTALLNSGAEWLFFIDHDTLVPPDVFIKMNYYMDNKLSPIVSGLYGTKGFPSIPLVFRGIGNHYYKDWKLGDRVWVDGTVMGCTIIHREIVEELFNVSDDYTDNEHALLGMAAGLKVRKVFKTPREIVFDPKTQAPMKKMGTEDLYFCDRIRKEEILQKTKTWKHLADKPYPFITDTSIFCTHIDNAGRQYPLTMWDIPKRRGKKITNSRMG